MITVPGVMSSSLATVTSAMLGLLSLTLLTLMVTLAVSGDPPSAAVAEMVSECEVLVS